MDDTGAALRGYLNDHLGGATAGVRLLSRVARTAPGPARAQLERLTADVVQDRQSLLEIMRRLDVPVRRREVLAGWLLETASRLRTDVRLPHRPLRELVALEALVLGVQGKAAGFRVLRAAAVDGLPLDAAALDRLVERAERQAATLERLRLQAGVRALAPT